MQTRKAANARPSKTRPRSAELQGGSENRAAQRTRAQLIESALDLFGKQGFDATTTRALAERARCNLAAIPYHFGSKEGLYRAVATHIADEIGSHIAPERARVEAALTGGHLTPQSARASLHALFDRLMDLILGTDKAARWAPFMLREQLEPSFAFDILYKSFMEPQHQVVSRLMGVATGQPPQTPENILRVFTLIGQVLAFRIARKAVLLRLKAPRFDANILAAVKAVVHKNIDSILDGVSAP